MAYLGQTLGQGQAERFVYTASGGETSVSLSDNGIAVNYTVGQVDVYLNGAKLIAGTDFTATDGATITGLSALSANDVVDIVALSTFQAADHYTKAEADVIQAANDRNPSRNSVVNQEPVTQGTSTRTGFSSTKYTGNGSAQSISTGVDMATGDFGGLVWIKNRDQADFNIFTDTIRGTDSQLYSNSTAEETTEIDNITSFDTTGVTVGSEVVMNTNTENYIAWSWQTNQKATGLTNRNKAYTAHYNTDLGFSIVGYEGDGVDGHEIPHHLGRVPELSIFKNRDTSLLWLVKSPLLGKDDYLSLNDTIASTTGVNTSTFWSDTTFTIDLGIAANSASDNHISYHFTSIPNVSKVGKYIGTGAAGNYVDCGFKVGWVMLKNLTTGTTEWAITDTIRGLTFLEPSSSDAESAVSVGFNDDGFLINTINSSWNALNDEYIFLAFAETSTDATKAWTDYEYATSQDTLSIQQNTLLSFANGFSSSGQVDTQENVGAGVTYSLGAGHENKHYWLYKDKGGSYGVTEYRPLEGTSRNQADKWGVQSPLDASLRTTAKHFDYESETGVALASGEFSTNYAYNAFNHIDEVYGNSWAVESVTTSWLQYKSNEKRVLKSWRFKQAGTATREPKRFTIEGSNDGLNWTAIDSTYTSADYTGNGVDLWGDLHSTSANTTAYLYHRINITANNGDATYTQLADLEFNTILPSDYYLIDEGKIYDSTGSQIERIYLAELMTNDDGEVSWYRNLPVAKQKITEAEVQGDLKVHGEIENRGMCTAWVKVYVDQNPPLIYEAHNIKDVVDIGTGKYYFKVDDSIDCTSASLSIITSNPNLTSSGYAIDKNTMYGRFANSSSQTYTNDASFVCVQVFGGKEVI